MIGIPKQIINWLLEQDKENKFEIKEYKEKRSLDANAYAWKLITDIGNSLRKSKEEVYLQMLKDYGQSEIIKITNKANPNDYFKYYEQVNEKDNYVYYKIYKGSSQMDSKEMSVLLDGIKQEAEQLGISTLTPNEISNLKSQWGGSDE